MVPAAPATLSITTGCLSWSASFGMIRRAVESTPPPAAKGTMTAMGLAGKFCACASAAPQTQTAASVLKNARDPNMSSSLISLKELLPCHATILVMTSYNKYLLPGPETSRSGPAHVA